MRIVLETAAEVTRALDAGELRCSCGPGRLRRWGWARPRLLRFGSRLRWIRPRRARCRACARTHVLLPASCLLRRLDDVASIGHALTEAERGSGSRRIAAALGLPRSTVRDWIRVFRCRVQSRHASDWPAGWTASPPDWRRVSLSTDGRLLAPTPETGRTC